MTKLGGFLITFEGNDGSGKSSIIERTNSWLMGEGLSTLCLREPGGTQIGEQIRQVIHYVRNIDMSRMTEFLLYSASRAQLVEEKIYSALEKGLIVMTDRFVDSSIAYQGYGREVPLDFISYVNSAVTQGIVPDLTLLLDIDPDIGIERRMNSRGEINRMDLQNQAYYRKVHQGYIELAKKDTTGRWREVDTNKPLEDVWDEVKNQVEAALLASGYLERRGKSSERIV